MSLEAALDIASGCILLVGSLFVVSGGVGLLRMPDFFSRTHAASLTDTAGAGLILLGLLFQVEDFAQGLRLALIALFLLFTGPTATHALASAALGDGLSPWTRKSGGRR